MRGDLNSIDLLRLGVFFVRNEKSALLKPQGIYTTTALALVKRGLGAKLLNKQSAKSNTIALLATIVFC